MFSHLFGKKQYTDLSPADFKEALNEDNEAILLDVRTQQEFSSGHLDKAIKMDLLSGEFAEKISQLDPQKTYYLYCRSGARSASASKQLAAAGFDKVFNLKGGYMAWK